ncbi:hypothetical protein ACGFNV_28995 [Streptomyces sp. NPDC048751]|uniref:hypothetical protein n=1 Tax=Streptomyces sp. NPDC048751 TaxID=3365591 RepID=UPI00371861E8
MGGIFTGRLREAGSRTFVVDIAPPQQERGPCLAADVTAPGPEPAAAVGHADLVLLADTPSGRAGMVAELATHAPGVEHVGLNPLFAPAAGMAGRPVVAVVTRDGPGVAALLRLVERVGGRPVRLRPRSTTGRPQPPRP